MSTSPILAIVGNPNCGKTTLFNGLTGARQRVGNWPGVTVEKRSGHYIDADGRAIEVVDLPGTYCLDIIEQEIAIDEQVARDYILENRADLILNIVDASNLERNLYLTSQLLDMNVPVVLVLNMMDVAQSKGFEVDVDALSQSLGCPVLTVTASQESSVKKLQQQLHTLLATEQTAAKPLPLSDPFEAALSSLAAAFAQPHSQQRWLSLKLLEGEPVRGVQLTSDARAFANRLRDEIEQSSGEDLDILLACARYDVIGKLMTQVVRQRGESDHKLTTAIDNVVLNRVLGFPIFLGVMYLMFMFSINVGGAFIDFFDGLVGTLLVDGLAYLLNSIGSPDWLTAMLADGIGGGIQTVATFIPVIGFLFVFLSILEDSGYMARAAFVVDRLMRFIGLPGKAFVPMLVGFGCNVPAVMAARTLENEKDRLLTIAMAPFMSCGARLPVYALFAAAFFPATGQNVVFVLYLVGLLAAVFTGLVLKNSLLKGESTPFLMELPNYHLPSLRYVLLRSWDRLKSFVLRAGRAIVMVVFVLNMLNSVGTDGSFGNEDSTNSVLSKVGQTITPMFAPMGMEEENWPAAVGLFTGILAKEAVVGTLNSMYGAISAQENGDSDADEPFDVWGGISDAFATIPENLFGIEVTDPLGIEVGDLSNLSEVAAEQEVALTTFAVMGQLFTSDAAVIAYLLMILLYTPCVAVTGAIYREVGVRWALFVACWTFLLGYSVATIYYQLSRITVTPVESGLIIAIVVLVMALVIALMKRGGGSDGGFFEDSLAS